MILMKSCPRCHGDLYQEDVLGGVELVCLQCGHRTYPEAQTSQSAGRVRVTRKAA